MPKKASGSSSKKTTKKSTAKSAAKKVKATTKTAKTKTAKTKTAKTRTAKAKSTKTAPRTTPKRAAAAKKATAATPSGAGRLRVTQMRSGIGHAQTYRATLRALGLKHHQDRVVVDDNPTMRGMLFKVRHLVRVTAEEA